MMQHNEDHELLPIAIVGIGCRLPGNASTPEKLWDLLERKQSARKEFPKDRLNVDAFYHPNGDKNGTMNNRAGHFLDEDISAFDAPFFSISPAEATAMDPMQRQLLEVVYEAMETGGISISQLAGTQTSCYVGCFTSDYDQIAKRDPETLPKYHATGTGQAILSNRISYCFDLKGPSVTLDTACSSSLVAVHLACQSLRLGESKTAIVGATHAILNPDIMVGMTNLHFLSPDSTCYTFDSRANGYARGEGMAALILKPLSDAVRDGDTVRAVIRGTAVNSNGKGSGITLPSRPAQVSLIRTAYEQAKCDPSVTAYVEAHGTGTAAGDPLEAGAIGDALGIHRPDGEENKLFVGSIKTNIGHLEGASGLAALVKTVMSLEKGLIAPNLWFEKGNPAIDFDAWRIRVPTEVVPWPSKGLRRASVNGFGYGGTNSHVILDDAYHYMRERGIQGKHQTVLPPGSDTDSVESWDSLSSQLPRPTEHGRIFLLSAQESASVISMAKSLAEHLGTTQPENEKRFLDNLAFTLSERRTIHDYGAAVVASSRSDLIEGLKSLSTSDRRSVSKPHIDFIFTGQGAQWFAMGRELLSYPVVAQTLAACNKAIQSFGASWSIVDELRKDKKTSRINEAEISQPICSALQIALIDLYASWNITPRSVVGHSSGEIAAAYATGALSLEAAMCASFYRGLLSSKIKTLGFKGGMMAAGLSEKEALEEIEKMGDASGKIVVACVNSPRSVTLSGDLPALNQMQKTLTPRGIFARKLEVETAYHSHHMLALADEYRQRMGGLEVVPWENCKDVKMFSSVTGQVVTIKDDLGADYWVSNMVSCVRFSDALSALCDEQLKTKPKSNEPGFLVELGPHAALAGPVKQVLASLSESTNNEIVPIKYLSVLTRGKGASITALSTASSLLTLGYPVHLHAANFPYGTPASGLSVLTDLPTYRWNHSRKYWSESRLSKDHRFRPLPRTDLLGAPSNDWNPFQPRWRNFIRLVEQPWVRSHVVQGAVVYPAAGFCCMALEAASQVVSGALQSKLFASTDKKVAEYGLRDVDISRALLVPDTEEGVEVALSMLPVANAHGNEAEFRVFSYTEASGWSEHCHGVVSVTFQDKDGSDSVEEEHATRLQTARDVCTTRIAQGELYKHLDGVGLYYGPEFQGIREISAGTSHALGTVQITDTAAGMPHGFQFPHLIHPATLDTFLQMSIAALSHGDLQNLTQPYVPIAIQEIRVSGGVSVSPGDKLEVAAESRLRSTRHALAGVTVMTDSERPLVQMKGVKLSAIASSTSSNEAEDVPSHTAVVAWEPDIDLISPTKLNATLRSSTPSRPVPRADYEFLAYHFFTRVLDEIPPEEVANMHAHHQKFYRYMQHQRNMVNTHTHEQQTSEWTKLHNPETQTRLAQSIQNLSRDPSDYEGRMFARIGAALPSILRKQVEPLALMMQDNLLHDYYTVALGMDGTYPQIARYISLLSHKYPNLSYLEIGAGTGGATVPVLQALGGGAGRAYPRMKSYTYTDISSGFFEQAQAKFGAWGSRLEFAKLDIEQDPKTQPGFHDDRRFDVVIAANVLHATYDMRRTMRHARSLLRPGGKLVLIDMTHSVMSVSLIFGTLPGWWHCSEEWREYGPLLDEARWRSVLRETGFSDFDASSPDVLDVLAEQTRVMVATAVEEPAPQEDHVGQGGKEKKVSKTTLLLIPDTPSESEREMIAATTSKFLAEGVAIDTCTLSESTTHADLSTSAILSLIELETSLLSTISAAHLAALQRIVLDAAGLIWVTRGSTHTKGTRPELSLFQGMARSLRAERESTTCVSVDFDVEPALSAAEAAALLFGLYEQSFGARELRPRLGVVDREFSEEGGVLKIKRAVEDERFNRLIAQRARGVGLVPEARKLESLGKKTFKARVRNVGALDSVVWVEDEAEEGALPEDYVEIDVRAVGLNPADLRNVMGEVDDDEDGELDDTLGGECSGVVKQVGSSVKHVAVGDHVVAWGQGLLATSARVAASLVAKIPASVSFADAAALPLAYVTAYYSLVQVARVTKEDTVLVHGAENSEGSAAVLAAKTQGATVIATVGSNKDKIRLMEGYGVPETHVFALSSSSYTGFANSVRKLGYTQGVDIIFNASSSTDEVKTSRTLSQLIAPFGRYLQLGTSSPPPDLPNNTSYTTIDVHKLLCQAPHIASSLITQSFSQTPAPTHPPTLPTTPFSSITSSLRHLHSNTYPKAILTSHPQDALPTLPTPLRSPRLSSSATYLLAGGFGGLGRSIARHLATLGARNLLFISRSGASTASSQTLLSDLNALGVRTEVLTCDITSPAALSTALSSTLAKMPPLRGVIQAAMQLRDSIFTNMTHEAWTTALAPKVQGSLALHEATLPHGTLDFFILLSSCAAFWGNAGQANYVAGCTYQVALAAHRRSRGLAACAIDVGKVSNVGFVAENAGTVSERNLVRLGLLDVREDEFLAILEQAMMGRGGAHVVTGVSSSCDGSDGREMPFFARDPVLGHMDFARAGVLRRGKGVDEKATASSSKAALLPLSTLLAGAQGAEDATQHVLVALQHKLSRALMMPLEELDAQKSLAAYGVDSLVAVELRNWVAREAKAELAVFDIVQAASLIGLAGVVAGRSGFVGK